MKKILLLFSFLLSFLVLGQEKKPNIIIFLVDDLGWADISLRGAPFNTPNIDSLFEEGVSLNRFYTTPICSPTRAALMTGRDPLKLGVAYSVIMPWMNNGIHPDEHFMPESFKLNGYQTAIIGKWHLGHSQETFHPNQRGFDHFYGHLHTEVGYFPPFANQGGAGGFGGQGGAQGGFRWEDIKDQFGEGEAFGGGGFRFDDIFSAFGRGARGQGSGRQGGFDQFSSGFGSSESKGQDQHAEINVDLASVYSGDDYSIKLNVPVRQPNGSVSYDNKTLKIKIPNFMIKVKRKSKLKTI